MIMDELKQRHGCVTFWLWLVILANLGMALYYSVLMFDAYTSEMSLGFGFLGILGIVNLLSAILLMRWNKLGFYMMLVSSLIGLLVNVGLLGLPSATVLSSLFAVLIWWAILHIRKNGISAWKLMNGGWDYKHCRHLYQVFIGIIVLMFVLTIIATLGNHDGNPYEKIIDDYDNTEIEIEPVEEEEVIPISDGIDWTVFEDKTNSVSIEAPSDFRRLNLNDDQLMALGCSDFDPYIAIVQESVSSLNDLGVTTTKEYSQLMFKMVQNSGSTDFKKLNQEPYGDNSYLVEYEMTVDGTKFYYKVIIIKTKRYFYYCQALCIDAYKYKLKKQIDHIIESFKVLK